jgi:hypothetical protein
MTFMKRISVLLGVLLIASATFAQGDGAVVRWKNVVGVITAPLVNNPVAGISSGLFPWHATRGEALVNLATGDLAFQVKGLVLVGTNFSGTRGDLTEVKGTLVCNPGTTAQAILDTDSVPFSEQGDAQFAGNLGSVPTPCTNPLFLVRLPANNRWIATGAVRVIGTENAQ